MSFSWNYISPNMRQQSLVSQQDNRRMRIDLQGNGDVIPSGVGLAPLPPGQGYRQIAAQYGGNSYSSVWVPVGHTIPIYVLNRATSYSAKMGRTVIFVRPSEPGYPASWWRLWDTVLNGYVDLNDRRYGRRNLMGGLFDPPTVGNNETQSNFTVVDSKVDVTVGINQAVLGVTTCDIEVWSPCYYDSDAHNLGLKNRDAAGAAWCRARGFGGVHPNGYQWCHGWWPSAYRFNCKDHNSKVWTPSFRDEDAHAMGLGSYRDRAGHEYCLSNGHDGWQRYQDEGNWYFSYQCYKWTPCFAGSKYDRNRRASDYCSSLGYDHAKSTSEYCYDTAWWTDFFGFYGFEKFKCLG